MNEFESILHIMMLNHVSYDDLAKSMGQANAGNIYNTLNKNKNIYVSSFAKILDKLGYDLVIRKKGENNGGYVINDDNTPSPLRFHDMSIEFGVEPEKRRLNLSRSERIEQTEELKKRVHELTPFECEEELRKIWSTINPVRRKMSTVSEYEGEYLNYRKEFHKLYGEGLPIYASPEQPKRKQKIKAKETPTLVEPVKTGTEGKIIIEDVMNTRDMSEGAVFDRAMKSQKSTSDALRLLVSGFQTDD